MTKKCKVCLSETETGEKLCEECLELVYRIYEKYTSEQISLLFSYAIGPRITQEWQDNMISNMLDRTKDDFREFDVLH